MTTETYTAKRLADMSLNEFQGLGLCLRAKAYRLCGWNWKKFIEIEPLPCGGFEVRYE